MNKKIILVLVVAVVLIGWYSFSAKNKSDSPANQAPTNTQTTSTTPEPKSTAPGGITTVSTPVQSTGKVQVDIKGFSFVSKTVKIAPGTTITWKNYDSAPHSVIGPDFKSPTLNQGQSFSHTFSKEGTFSYFCGFHPNMSGEIIVRP